MWFGALVYYTLSIISFSSVRLWKQVWPMQNPLFWQDFDSTPLVFSVLGNTCMALTIQTMLLLLLQCFSQVLVGWSRLFYSLELLSNFVCCLGLERLSVFCIDVEIISFNVCRNFQRSANSGTQLYGRGRGSRGRGPVDETQSVRRGTKTISQSQQLQKLPSQSTDQNLSDVGNEEWETASESSDVLAQHHVHDKQEDSKSSAGREVVPGSKRDVKKTFASYQADRSHRDNLSEPRSVEFSADGRNGQHNMRSSSNGNSRTSQRGGKDHGSSRNLATSTSDAANKLVWILFVLFDMCSSFDFVWCNVTRSMWRHEVAGLQDTSQKLNFKGRKDKGNRRIEITYRHCRDKTSSLN